MLKRKYNILNANYDPETGISFVEIQTPLGNFSAHSRCLDEDRATISSFFGCQVAEMKAFVKYANRQIQQQKDRIKILTETYKEMEEIYNFNYNSVEAIFTRKKIEREENKLAEMYENKDLIKKHIQFLIFNRDNYLKKLWSKTNKISE